MNRQCEAIVEYMNGLHGITAWEAMQDLGIMRLASRIHDLHTKGIETHREMEKSPSGARYARYYLMDEIREVQNDYDRAMGEVANG